MEATMNGVSAGADPGAGAGAGEREGQGRSLHGDSGERPAGPGPAPQQAVTPTPTPTPAPASASAMAPNTAAPGAEILEGLTTADLVDAIQAAGCAVTPVSRDGGVQLSSACHGVGFNVLWGNAAAPGCFIDITLSCPLRMQGGVLPDEVFAGWHRSKRFARLSRHDDYVVLEMDVIAAGGITRAHLQVMLKLWTQMVGQFLAYLRHASMAAPN